MLTTFKKIQAMKLALAAVVLALSVVMHQLVECQRGATDVRLLPYRVAMQDEGVGECARPVPRARRMGAAYNGAEQTPHVPCGWRAR